MAKKIFKYFDTDVKTEDIIEKISNFAEYQIQLEFESF